MNTDAISGDYDNNNDNNHDGDSMTILFDDLNLIQTLNTAGIPMTLCNCSFFDLGVRYRINVKTLIMCVN